MNIKDRIIENLINKILNKYPKPARKYGLRFYNGRVVKYSKSQHKTKSGVFYNKFCRVHFRAK